MKIKANFVTNSSSSSYIVCIPDWFELNYKDEKLKEAYDEYFHFNDGLEANKEIFKEMKRLFRKLKTQKLIRQSAEACKVYYALCHYFHLSDFLITSFETGEQCGFIENIKVETLNEVFISINKDLIYNSLKFLEKDKND